MSEEIVKLPGDTATKCHIWFNDPKEAGKYFYEMLRISRQSNKNHTCHIVAFIARIALAVVLGFCTYGTCIWTYHSIDKFDGERYDVPGVVMGKNVEQYAHGKHHRNMSTRYVMAVHPDNQTKFHNYSLYVDYATYCGYNVGDRIQFNDQSASTVLRGYKSKDFWEFARAVIIPIITCIIALICTIGMVIDAFVDYNY